MAVHRVFVYGTLKKAEPNHHWLTDATKGIAKFVGLAETVHEYPLVIATKYNIPFLLDSSGVGQRVTGEVYEVDQHMLSNLDLLEDHPNFYVRKQEKVELKPGGDVIENTWIYFITKFKQGLLGGPFLSNYSSSGSHGLVYKERYLRNPSDDFKTDILSDDLK